MADSLAIRIAGHPMQLEIDCSALTWSKVIAHYAAFSISPAPRALTIRVGEAPGDRLIPLKISSVSQIRTHIENGCIEFESHCEKGWLDCFAACGELILRPFGDPENFLRAAYAWRALEQRGFLLHAARVNSNCNGYAFSVVRAAARLRPRVSRLKKTKPC